MKKKLKWTFMTICIAFILTFIHSRNAEAHIVNPNKTYTYNIMVNDLKKLKKKYPDLVDYQVIGKSEYGRNIYAVSLGKGDSTVFINGSHHAREWMTTTVNMNMIDKYAYAYTKGNKINGYNVKTILNNTTIWFIPMVNPDGVILQQSGLKHFPAKDHAALIKMNGGSKNFKRWKANAKGVDLNRQYNSSWSKQSGPSSPYYYNYKGKSPESASEVKAVLNLVNKTNPEMAISYHSSGEIIFWKYGQSAPRYKQDQIYANQLRKMTGYSLVGSTSYGGGFSNWFQDKKNKPGFTIEIAPYAGQTHVPLKNFPKIWSQNQAVGLYTAQEGFKLYDKRYTTQANKLRNEIRSFNTEAAKLKDYYYHSIKSENHLNITAKQLSLYNKTVSEIKTKEKAIAKLPKNYQKSANASLSTVKAHRDRFSAYQKALISGDKLLSLHKTLLTDIQTGKLTLSTINKHSSFNKQLKTVKVRINRMYGKEVQRLATSKYITKTMVNSQAINNIMTRYELLIATEVLLEQGNFEEVTSNLEKITVLTNEAETYEVSFAHSEAFLQVYREKIEATLPMDDNTDSNV